MAYVYMKGSRSSVSLLVNYVLNPEKTTEMTDTERLELHQERAGERRSDVSALRSEKRKYVTCLNCTEENAIRQFQETKFIEPLATIPGVGWCPLGRNVYAHSG